MLSLFFLALMLGALVLNAHHSNPGLVLLAQVSVLAATADRKSVV